MNIERTPLAQQEFDSNPIADFAAEVERAAHIGRVKLALEQKGTPHTETDEYLEFGGYRIYKHGRDGAA